MELIKKETISGVQEISMLAKGKIRIQTKVEDGEWEDVLVETVPNTKMWEVNLSIHVIEK